MTSRQNHALKLATILLLVSLSSCSSPPPLPPFTMYQDLSVEQAAILEAVDGHGFIERIISWWEGATIYDRLTHRYERRFKLRPGKFDIHYGWRGGPEDPIAFRTDTVELRAGHTYSIKGKNRPCGLLAQIFKRSCAESRTWIENATTGEMVAGEKWN